MEPRFRRQNSAAPPRGPVVASAPGGSHSHSHSSASKRTIWDGSFVWKVRANKTVYKDRIEYNQTIDCKFFCKLACYKEANVDTTGWLSVMQLVPLPEAFRRELAKGFFATPETSTKLLITFSPNSNLQKFNMFMRSSRRMMMLQTTTGPNTTATSVVFLTHDTGRKDWIIFTPKLHRMSPSLLSLLPAFSPNLQQPRRNVQAVLQVEVNANANAQNSPRPPIVRLVDPQRQISVCLHHHQPQSQRLQPQAIVFPSQPAPGNGPNIAVIDLRGLGQGQAPAANNNRPQQAPPNNAQRPPAQQVVAQHCQHRENVSVMLRRRMPHFPGPYAQHLLGVGVPRQPQAPVRMETVEHHESNSSNQEECIMDVLEKFENY